MSLTSLKACVTMALCGPSTTGAARDMLEASGVGRFDAKWEELAELSGAVSDTRVRPDDVVPLGSNGGSKSCCHEGHHAL